jgi:hypothetical protein
VRDFEADGVDEELLLDGDEGVEEETGLGPDICKGGRRCADEISSNGSPRSREEAVSNGLICLFGIAVVKSVGRIGCSVQVDEVLSSTVPIVVVDLDMRAIDRELFEIGPAVAIKLGVQVRVDAALKEGILAKVDSSNDVTRLEL